MILHTQPHAQSYTYIHIKEITNVKSQYLLMINIQTHNSVCNQCTTPQSNQLHSVFSVKDIFQREASLVFLHIFIEKTSRKWNKGARLPQDFCFSWMQEPLKGLIWLVNTGKRALSLSTGCRKDLKITRGQQWKIAKKWEQRKATEYFHCSPSSLLHLGVLFSHSCRWDSFR